MMDKNINEEWLDTQMQPEEDEAILLKRALLYEKAKGEVDVEAELERFEAKYFGKDKGSAGKAENLKNDKAKDLKDESITDKLSLDKQSNKIWLKIAAVFVGLLMLSGISYAAYHITKQGNTDEQTVVKDSITVSQPAKKQISSSKTWQEVEPNQKSPVVFEDAELSTILKYIADKTNVKVAYHNESAAHVRFYLQWEQGDSLQDIIDKVNHFEKVHLSFDEAKQLIVVE